MATTRRRTPWKAQDRDERAHELIEHILDTYGLGHELAIPMAHHHAANAGRLSVRSAARHYGLSCATWVSSATSPRCVDCPDENTPHVLHIRLYSKEEGRQFVIEQTGGDPGRLKYNPHEKDHGPRGFR